MVLRRCRYILKDEEAAVDAMQDVFVQVLRKQEKLTTEAPSSLLYTIATNICLNKIRSANRRRETAGDSVIDMIAGFDDPAERAVNAHFLQTLFSREPESTRTIAMLHYVDRLTLEETALRMGMSVSGVRKRLRKLRKIGLELVET